MGILRREAPIMRIWRALTARFPVLQTYATRATGPLVSFWSRSVAPHIITYRAKTAERREAARVQAALEARQRAEWEAEEARKRYDPKGAIEDLRLVYSYLEDWENKKGGLDVLAFAAKYIAKARQKDSNAKLVIDTKDEPLILSLDDLSGRTLFYEGQHYASNKSDKASLTRAADILRRAIAYQPYSIQIREHLANVYLDLHDKKTAVAVAMDALESSPTDLNARKLFDRIEAAPITRPPPRFQGLDVGCVLPLIMLALIGFAIYSLFQGEFSAAFTLIVIALILGGILRFVEGDRMFRKALEHERDEAQRKRRGL
jgi:hypothetical protein